MRNVVRMRWLLGAAPSDTRAGGSVTGRDLLEERLAGQDHPEWAFSRFNQVVPPRWWRHPTSPEVLSSVPQSARWMRADRPLPVEP